MKKRDDFIAMNNEQTEETKNCNSVTTENMQLNCSHKSQQQAKEINNE